LKLSSEDEIGKLLETFGVIDPLIEDTKAFQLCRLEYQFDRFCAKGLPFRPSKLLRAATLKSEWRETVEAMFHRASASLRGQP
jgi:hypothetical protein